VIKCSECHCVDNCRSTKHNVCTHCTKEVCCCVGLHIEKSRSSKHHSAQSFLGHVRTFFAAALGIEILCISAAVIGENTALYFFGYNLQGIVLGYIMGYTAAGFATFMTILGRYNLNSKIDSCCSVLEQQSNKGFIANLVLTFKNFGLGISKMLSLHKQSNIKYILKTSLIILFTAETVCILTAETVDLVFYDYSLLLSIPLALLAGTFTVVSQEAYKKITMRSENV
jgi:hypothetical protein